MTRLTPDSDALDAILARYGGIRVAAVRMALVDFQRRLPGRFSARDVAMALQPVVRPTLTPDAVREIAAGLGFVRAAPGAGGPAPDERPK